MTSSAPQECFPTLKGACPYPGPSHTMMATWRDLGPHTKRRPQWPFLVGLSFQLWIWIHSGGILQTCTNTASDRAAFMMCKKSAKITYHLPLPLRLHWNSHCCPLSLWPCQFRLKLDVSKMLALCSIWFIIKLTDAKFNRDSWTVSVYMYFLSNVFIISWCLDSMVVRHKHGRTNES